SNPGSRIRDPKSPLIYHTAARRPATAPGRMGMRRFLGEVSVRAVIILLTAASAWAQATAQLDGRVTDESGAVLPGVTVTATQTATTFTRTVVTDVTGNYVMTNLPTGPFRLEISLQGFRT